MDQSRRPVHQRSSPDDEKIALHGIVISGYHAQQRNPDHTDAKRMVIFEAGEHAIDPRLLK